MKLAGWVLLVIGVVMLLVKGINFKTKEKVVDLGPVEINKTENHPINWPLWAGGVFTIAGVVMLVSSSRQKA
jgi:hypothetical protein